MEAPMPTHERIEINPEIMGGKPVIRGTRVPVEIVLRKLGAGMTPEAIVNDHPRLTLDDIRAAQAFAADYLADEALVYGQAGVRWVIDECVDADLASGYVKRDTKPCTWPKSRRVHPTLWSWTERIVKIACC
jgi:uncharacterized protein (DUF433 family)